MFWNKNKVSKNSASSLVNSSKSDDIKIVKKLKTIDLSTDESLTPYKNVPFPGQEFVVYESKNRHVEILQKNLISRGYNIPDGADGTYGIATVLAVKKFYDDKGLGMNSGKHIGPKAWNVLFGN